MFQLNHVIQGNTVVVWAATLAVAAALAASLCLARYALMRYLSGLESWKDTQVDRLLMTLLRHCHPLVLVALACAVAGQIPNLPARVERILQLLAPMALLLQAGLWGNAAIGFWLASVFREAETRDRALTTRSTVISFLLRLALGSLVLIMALSILGFNITTLLASLGIGGIAVALAIQNILGDLFASLSIALDRPFEVGDFIVVDEFLGTVDYVGLKTTRVRSLSGEQIIFSNTDLLKSRIRNFKRMTDRRVLFSFGVARETPAEQLRQLPEAIRRIVEGCGRARFDRAHFKEFKETSLAFEVVYYIQGPDYNLYMDIQQDINLELHRLFTAQGIQPLSPRPVLCLQAEAV